VEGVLRDELAGGVDAVDVALGAVVAVHFDDQEIRVVQRQRPVDVGLVLRREEQRDPGIDAPGVLVLPAAGLGLEVDPVARVELVHERQRRLDHVVALELGVEHDVPTWAGARRRPLEHLAERRDAVVRPVVPADVLEALRRVVLDAAPAVGLEVELEVVIDEDVSVP